MKLSNVKLNSIFTTTKLWKNNFFRFFNLSNKFQEKIAQNSNDDFACVLCFRISLNYYQHRRQRDHVSTNRILIEYWTQFSCRFSTIVWCVLVSVGNRFHQIFVPHSDSLSLSRPFDCSGCSVAVALFCYCRCASGRLRPAAAAATQQHCTHTVTVAQLLSACMFASAISTQRIDNNWERERACGCMHTCHPYLLFCRLSRFVSSVDVVCTGRTYMLLFLSTISARAQYFRVAYVAFSSYCYRHHIHIYTIENFFHRFFCYTQFLPFNSFSGITTCIPFEFSWEIMFPFLLNSTFISILKLTYLRLIPWCCYCCSHAVESA